MKKEYREKRRKPMDEIRNAIIEDPFSIKKIKNPSNEIIKFAIENDVNVIQYIKNPSDEIVQYAKKVDSQKMKNYYKGKNNNYIYIRISDNHFSNKLDLLSEDGIIELLKNKGAWLKYIDSQTEEMIIAAINNNFSNIEFAKKLTFNVLKKLVEIHPDKSQKYMISKDGKVLKKENEYSKSIFDYVIETLNTNELSLLVDSNIEVVKRMAVVPYELQIKIVKESYSNLRYIKNIDTKVYEYLYNNPNFKISDIGEIQTERKVEDCFAILKNYGRKDKENTVHSEGKIVAQQSFSKIFDRENINNLWEKMRQDLINEDFSVHLLNNEVSLNEYLMVFAENIQIQEINIACGYVYKSGLDKLKNIFDKFDKDKGEINLIIGSLKNYFFASTDDKLINIDLDTAKELNSMLLERKCEIYTLENKFFHGKYYFFKGKDYSCCMIGSSNLTSGGFTKNYELNTIYLIKNNSQIYNTFYVWFLSFKEKCTKIYELNECKFIDTRIDFDSITSKNLFSIYSETDAKNEIEMLTDQDLKFRLNIWLEKKPSGIYSRFNINSFKNYIAFEYKEFNLVVFESLISANGYYYFDNKNIFQLMQEIKSLTKTEIFEISGMTKRGYHNKNRESLKNTINKLFENKN